MNNINLTYQNHFSITQKILLFTLIIFPTVYFTIQNYQRNQIRTQNDFSVTRFNRIASQSYFIYQVTKAWKKLSQSLKIMNSPDNFNFKLNKQFCYQY